MDTPYKSAQHEPHTYIDPNPFGGHLHEVATALVIGNNLILDFYYSDATGPAAGQALYSLEQSTQALAYARGGTLAWSGLISWHEHWLFAQGWDARPALANAVLHRTDHSPRLNIEHIARWSHKTGARISSSPATASTQQFRRIIGYRDLATLVIAIEGHNLHAADAAAHHDQEALEPVTV